MRKKLLFLVSLLFTTSLIAQNIKVTGTVKDEAGEALIGATVMLKESAQGSTTDFDGNYSIEANQGDVLVFRYLGYITQEVTVGSESQIDITLGSDNELLDEVVVVGYVSVRKGDVTGAVSSMKMDELADLPVTNSVISSLQGRVAGLQVVSSGQGPGSTSSIIIRGASSLRGSQQPLIVLNGFPMGEGADLKQINPSDIEDVVVLKDASSTSIYGSRGANGVILVTTKKSAMGQRRITFSHQTTLSDLTSSYNVWKSPVLMAQLDNESRINAGQRPLYIGREELGVYYPSIAEIQSGAFPTTNWADETTHTPITNTTTFGLSGAGEKVNYNLSASYFDEKGLFIGDNYNKLTTNLDLTYRLYDNFSIKSSTILSTNSRDNNGYGGIDRNILYPVLNEDGTYFKSNYLDFGNPVALRNLRKDEVSGTDVITSFLFDWTLIEGLSWKNQINYKFGQTISDQYDPTVYTQLGEDNNGRAYIGNWQGQELLYESYLS